MSDGGEGATASERAKERMSGYNCESNILFKSQGEVKNGIRTEVEND